MKTCSYCKTEIKEYVNECTFCNAPLKIKRPKQKELLTIDHAQKPFQEIIEYHTYDLLILLRLVRRERTTAYDMMIRIQRLLQKATGSSQHEPSDLELVGQAETYYKHYTARMNVLEGILIDRMGYKPKRVDDKLLDSLKIKMQQT